MRRIFILIFCQFITLYHLEAQVNNTLLESNTIIQDSTSGSLMLQVHSANGFKNNEYFNTIVPGYTLFNSQLLTSLAYQPNGHFSIQVGAFMRKDYGYNTVLKVEPFLRLKYAKNGYSVLAGNIESNVGHRMLDPLFAYERYFDRFLEQGLQFKVDRKKVWSDTWINWERMQYPNDPSQEEFTFGHSSDWLLMKKDGIRLSAPLQLVVTHRGGQLDVDTTPLKSLSNIGVGFRLQGDIANKLFKYWYTENYFLGYKDLSPTKRQAFDDGRAFFLNAGLVSKYDISLSLGVWSSTNFIASRGAYLFQNVPAFSLKQPIISSKQRQLVLLRLLYQKEIFDGFLTDIRFEPHYDIGESLFEYTYSIYLTYKHNFNLINLKKAKRN